MGEKIWAEVIASAATVVSAWALWRTFVLERLVKGPRFWGWIREVRDEQWELTVGASGELEAHSVTVASSAFVGQAVFGLIRGNGSALHKSVVVLSGENVPGDNMGRRFPALDIEYVDVGGYRWKANELRTITALGILLPAMKLKRLHLVQWMEQQRVSELKRRLGKHL